MRITQQAFTGSGKLLKGALHCHTTRSDGEGDPADVIRLHAKNGYDFMALTDHRRYNYENFAPETNMTIIPGMEMDAGITTGDALCFHTVVLGPAKADGNPFEQDQRFESGRVRNQFEYQATLDWLHESNQLTTMCHPEWSCTPVRMYEHLHGNFALELWNTGCAWGDHLDRDNQQQWDDLLVNGMKIYGIAVDDGHGAMYHCQGWVMVNAENNVDAILEALKNGAFYASTGPEIFDFWIDDENVAHVKCSACSFVRFHSAASITRKLYGEKGSPIMEASMPVRACDTYLRVEVTDLAGRVAWSNPIFLGK